VPPSDLELAKTDELVEELKRRADHVVVMFTRPGKAVGSDWDVEYAYKGPATAVLGLIVAVKALVKQEATGMRG